MKLVDILARELKEWPKGRRAAVQSGEDAEIYFDGGCADDVYVNSRAEDGGLNGSAVTQEQWKAAVDSLKAATWSGEGHPPAGTVCELRMKLIGSWSKAKILFVRDSAIVWEWVQHGHAYAENLANVEFRPLRTAEQIAADERLHKVRNALTRINASRHFPGDEARQNVMVATVEAMIDAGFVQQVAP